jgi:uncharacterized protein (TIGR02118 family)
MFKISILYPNIEGMRCDVDYDVRRHMPLVQSRPRPLGLAGVAAENGTHGGTAGSATPIHGMSHLLFETLDAYKAAMRAHRKELAGDVANFTTAAFLILINEAVS